MKGRQECRPVGYKHAGGFRLWRQRGEKCLWSLERSEELENIHPGFNDASSSINSPLATLFTYPPPNPIIAFNLSVFLLIIAH